ncbi:peroxisomal acyl-coenzyme A oxidase 3 isoform X18 [Drosophila biarmipes]|uniref:peroxisomal acyl-coenzyme A oxidase 3 isoform X18 n=1 Tax=Drosophila biarmipes TaxID=125945 RepID=UPI0021CCA4E4|nr:peroxisomal acyl-coenzyme A oxidase 3 isoform X18 [Drosophila biarmipes]
MASYRVSITTISAYTAFGHHYCIASCHALVRQRDRKSDHKGFQRRGHIAGRHGNPRNIFSSQACRNLGGKRWHPVLLFLKTLRQECREACGGHGYLKSSGLGDLRNDNDANCTYEGENNTLIQQASNWLISLRCKNADFVAVSPLETVSFLKDMDELLQSKSQEGTPAEAMDVRNLLKALNWLTAWQLETTVKRVEEQQRDGKNAFETRNNIQVFYAQKLSIIYGERTIYHVFYKFVSCLHDSVEKKVLEQLLSFYGAHLITKYASVFYRGGYFRENSHELKLYEKGILGLLSDLKDEAIALVDAIAPTDFILNSPLGVSDGNVYQHLQRAIVSAPGVFERPHWWRDVTYKDYLKGSNLTTVRAT